jgi:glutamate decarboxylase
MPLHTQVDESSQDDAIEVNPVYVQELGAEIPRYRLPEHGMLPRTALQVVRDELILDGNARLNLATFVTNWMEPETELLMAECAAKNMIDKDEYPQTAELERRCVNILSSLWNADARLAGAGIYLQALRTASSGRVSQLSIDLIVRDRVVVHG